MIDEMSSSSIDSDIRKLLNGLIRTDRQLVEHFLQTHRVSEETLFIAGAEFQRAGGKLYEHLVRLGFVTETEYRDAAALIKGIQTVNLLTHNPDPIALQIIPAALALRYHILPLGFSPTGHVQLATSDSDDLVAIDHIHAHLKHIDRSAIEWFQTTPSDLRRAIDRHYGQRQSVQDFLNQFGNDPPMDELVQLIFKNAYDLGASDIHFEPEAHILRVRLRIDGVLRQVHVLHAQIWSKLSVKLKLLAEMNIAENRAAQDGRFSLKLSERVIDFRSSCLPTTHGENIVIRVLDSSRNISSIDQFGISEDNLAKISQLLAKPEGIVLVTGPTGSGKTTTLYSLLSEISVEGVNIMTLEDPIEYPLPLIRQTQVSEKISFADGIRALMRQDPDVILVGEVRDTETAEMAIRAAMTGHQVFATLHTNSALGAVQRLKDIGIAPYLLAGNLVGVIGQRLARRLCPHCKRAVPLSAEQRQALSDVLPADAADEPHIYEAVGCDHCYGLGYRGRMVLMEILQFTRGIDDLVSQEASPNELMTLARSQGYKTLRDDAIAKLLAGLSSWTELGRVVSLAER